MICSDKTGTLTTNMMSAQKVLVVDSVRNSPVTFREYIIEGASAALCDFAQSICAPFLQATTTARLVACSSRPRAALLPHLLPKTEVSFSLNQIAVDAPALC